MSFTNSIRRYCAALCLLLLPPAYSSQTFAQSGLNIKACYVHPKGNFGAEMKKTLGVEVGLASPLRHGNIFTKVGLYYTNFQPRLDTFPISIVRHDYIPTVYPGVRVWEQFTTYGFFADFSFKIAQVKKFALFLGPGVSVGKVRYKYYESYETVGGGAKDVNDFIVGFRNHINIDYTVNNRWKIALEAHNLLNTTLDWQMRTTINNYSLSFTYFFHPIEK